MQLDISVYGLRVPMDQVFVHVGAQRSIAENVVVKVSDGDIAGYGECCPRTYVTGEDVGDVISTLLRLRTAEIISQIDLTSFASAIQSIDCLNFVHFLDVGRPTAAAACALELALLDYLGKRFSQRLDHLPGLLALNDSCFGKSDRMVPASYVIDYGIASEELRMEKAQSHLIKLKVGKDLELDIQRLKLIRDIVGWQVPVVLDANLAWSYDEASRCLEQFQEFQIGWVEEPLFPPRSYDQLCAIRKSTGVAIMLDESFCTQADLKEAIYKDAFDLLNIRISKCGGMISSFRLASQVMIMEKGVQIGCQVGEVGPLWAAARIMAQVMPEIKAYENGQADRWFNKPLFFPAPFLDRKTYRPSPLMVSGLGLEPTSSFQDYVFRREMIKVGKDRKQF